MNAATLPGALVRHRMAVLAVIGLVVYVVPLGLRDLWFPNEPELAEVCRAMEERDDWVVPHRNGEPWVDYPPMLYWAGAASSRALGSMTAFSLRLPSALAAIGLVLLTCAAATRAFDERTGLWAGFVLLTFEQFAMQAPAYRPDMPFSLWIGAGLFVYAHALVDRERPRWGGRVLAFVLFGLAVLTKGPLGLLLPGFVLTLWHATRREWRWLLQLAPLSLVACAVALPWYVACAHQIGADDLVHEVFQQNLARFGSAHRGHGRPITYYLVHVWLDLAIWSPLLPVAVLWLVRSGRWRSSVVQLAFWWFGAIFVFLSLAVTKRELYLLPALPAAAFVLAPWLARVGRAKEPAGETGRAPQDARPARVALLALAFALVAAGPVVGAGVVFLPSLLPRLELDPLRAEVVLALRAPAVALGVLFTCSGAWILSALRRSDLRSALRRGAAFQVPAMFLIFVFFLPALNPTKTYAPAGRWLAARISPARHLGFAFPALAEHKAGAFGFYTGARVELLDSADEIRLFLLRHPASVVLVHEPDAEGLLAERDPDWSRRIERRLVAGGRRYVVLAPP